LNYFLQIYFKKYKKTGIKILQSTLSKLMKYKWPGNIRELQHSVERAVILSDGKTISFSDFTSELVTKIDKLKDGGLNLEEMEKRFILKAISKNNGNITKAAVDLGIARAALYRRLEKYGL